MEFSEITDVKFSIAHSAIVKDIKAFGANAKYFFSSDYSEQQARLDFVDKFWIALGWDVQHVHQLNPYKQEVKVERNIKDEGRSRRADYAFLKPNFRDARFFVEAKRPGAPIDTDDNCFQVNRYGWNSSVPLSVLHNFAEIRIVDCRLKPNISDSRSRVVKELSFTYTDLLDANNFAKIYFLFSRDSVQAGALEDFASTLKRPGVGRITRERGQVLVGEDFLARLDHYRGELARSFKNLNEQLDSSQLTEIVQRTIDRIVFARFLEDKLIEPEPFIKRVSQSRHVWKDFLAQCRRLDSIYNGIIYRRHPILDGRDFAADDNIMGSICRELSDDNTPYAFNYIPIHVLGSIYERFLTKTIVATDKRAEVVTKPENRRKNAVFYTPEHIVRFIISQTVDKMICDLEPQQIAQLRFADIAAGSGSFLLGIFDSILRRLTEFYNSKGNKRVAKDAGCWESPDDATFHLSLRQKRDVLRNNVFGVDLDPQAVEVAQLSLYLKLLEEETTATASSYQLQFGERLLPDLSENVRNGNGLIGWDITQTESLSEEDEARIKPFNFETFFGTSQDVFDGIVGNPPYIQLSMKEFRDDKVVNYLKMRYGMSGGRANSFIFFMERARELTKKNGMLSYIVPNTVTTQESYTSLRKNFLYGTFLETIAYTADSIFGGAVVENCIVTATKTKMSTVVPSKRVEFLELSGTDQRNAAGSSDQRSFLRNFNLAFTKSITPDLEQLRKKMLTNTTPLGAITSINQAIALKQDRGACLVSAPLSAEYHEMLDGRHVDHYWIGDSQSYFEFDVEKIHSCKREDIFTQAEKILFRRVGSRLTAAIEREQKFALNTLFVVSRKPGTELDLRFLVGLLNSSLLNVYFRVFLKSTKKIFSEIQARQVEQLPIPSLNLTNGLDRAVHESLVRLVRDRESVAERIHGSFRTEEQHRALLGKAEALDRSIDESVFRMYGLTPKQIELVRSLASDN